MISEVKCENLTTTFLLNNKTGLCVIIEYKVHKKCHAKQSNSKFEIPSHICVTLSINISHRILLHKFSIFSKRAFLKALAQKLQRVLCRGVEDPHLRISWGEHTFLKMATSPIWTWQPSTQGVA